MKQRNINLDVIRSVAVMYIMCIHFSEYAGFYNGILAGPTMYVGTIMRNCFIICVPMFLLITGYLQCKKNLTTSYFKGIGRILLIYGLSCIPIWLFRAFYYGETFTIGSLIKSYLGFEGYGWYIAMYIGLFCLIPFLNLIFNNLENKKQRQLLLLVLLFITGFPSLQDIIGFQIVPDFWVEFYPITYYFIGAYIREYANDIKFSATKLFFLYIASVVMVGTIIFGLSYNKFYYEANVFRDWANLLYVCTSTLLFLFLLKCDFSKMPNILKKFFQTTSRISLQLFLVSLVFDAYIYSIFNMYFVSFGDKLIRFFIPTTLVFTCSFVVALIIDFIYNCIQKISAR